MKNPSTLQNFKILESLSKVKPIRDFRLKDLLDELDMDSKQPAPFYRALVKEARDGIALLVNLQLQLDSVEKAKDHAVARVSLLEQKLTEATAKVVSLEADNQLLQETASQLRTMAGGNQALKAVLIGEATCQTLQNLSELIHAAYMAKMVAEIKKSPAALEPKQMEILRQKLRAELRGMLQIPETALEKELNYVKEQNAALIAALLASSLVPK